LFIALQRDEAGAETHGEGLVILADDVDRTLRAGQCCVDRFLLVVGVPQRNRGVLRFEVHHVAEVQRA